MKLSLFVFDIQFRSTITIQLMNQQWHMEILQLFYFDNDFFFFFLIFLQYWWKYLQGKCYLVNFTYHYLPCVQNESDVFVNFEVNVFRKYKHFIMKVEVRNVKGDGCEQ